MEPSSESRLGSLPPAERTLILRGEIDRVVARLAVLGPDGLGAAAKGQWTVREVVAHLGLVAGFYTDSIRRGAMGDASVSGGRPAAGTGRGEVAADAIREGAAAVAEAQDDVVGRFRQAAVGLADALDGDGSGAPLDHPCYHPGGIVPANRFLVLYLKELGLHEWDVFEALEPPCSMSRWGVDAAFQAMEEELASGSLRWVTDPARNPRPVTIRVSTRGAVAAERDLILEPEWTRLVPVDDGRAVDGRLALDAADFVLACSGRLDLVAALSDGRAEGDVEPVRVLAGRLTGM